MEYLSTISRRRYGHFANDDGYHKSKWVVEVGGKVSVALISARGDIGYGHLYVALPQPIHAPVVAQGRFCRKSDGTVYGVGELIREYICQVSDIMGLPALNETLERL
jgi:hypothetical protein